MQRDALLPQRWLLLDNFVRVRTYTQHSCCWAELGQKQTVVCRKRKTIQTLGQIRLTQASGSIHSQTERQCCVQSLMGLNPHHWMAALFEGRRERNPFLFFQFVWIKSSPHWVLIFILLCCTESWEEQRPVKCCLDWAEVLKNPAVHLITCVL